VLAEAPRVAIDSPRLKGSIRLAGARLDDVVLKDYHLTVEPGSPNIELLNPEGAPDGYFAEWGWSSTEKGVALPDSGTVWQADGDTLTIDHPLTLTWDNGAGLRFVRTYAIDADYMFTVTQRVENTGQTPVTLYPYGLIRRIGTPPTLGFAIMHEGPLGVLDGTLRDKEVKYSALRKAGRVEYQTTGGWLGITDKYWLAALVPDPDEPEKVSFHYLKDGTERYQTDYLGAAHTVPPGGSVEDVSRFFAGAKEVKLLVHYRDALGIPLFDRAVDFAGYIGLPLTWIAKPVFFALDFIYGIIGNFGIAILLLTVAVKLIFFPLANKSYRAMSKMKQLAPEMARLRERYKDDRQKLSQETMALYKREKVNPASGCLPMIVQIPVFIALYQVLFVTIEMRHAPFFGWIKDLSAPDPTSILNLFGLLPWPVPDLGPLNLISIGVWPIVMGLTMFLQQKLNPAPPDPVQARIFMMLPIVFTFMLAHFPAGLVIYWAWNNLLSIAQQRLIMWRMGVKG
ncbi:MAG: membrane protein insertase YidC, partial [Rhodospirillaceae bacterium]|nr:membrane protein insertase YidC [Rhodospirillaceae bacterium]